jgi:hypothetical protein
MKRLTFFALPIVLLFSSCVVAFPFDGVVGNGNVSTFAIPTGSFTAVKNLTSATVFISKGNSAGASVTIDANVVELLDIRAENGVLIISLKPGKSIMRTTKFTVDAVLPILEEIEVHSSGNIKGISNFSGRDLKLSINGSGSISGVFDYERIYARINGSGSIGATCNANLVDAKIAGSGDIVLKGRAYDTIGYVGGSGCIVGNSYTTGSARVSIFGSGSTTLRIDNEVHAIIGGSGSVLYYGAPRIVEVQDNGSGSLRKIGN